MTRHSVGTWEDDYCDGGNVQHDDYVEEQIEEYGKDGWDIVTDESRYREFIEDTSDDEVLWLIRRNDMGNGNMSFEEFCECDSETKEESRKYLSEMIYK